MNEATQELDENEIAIRTSIRAGDQMMGSGAATGGNTGGDSDPGRQIYGSGS
jgi:hypothetical protein